MVVHIGRQDITKLTKISVHTAEIKINLGIRPGFSVFSLCAHLVTKGPSFLHKDRDDSDQTKLV